MCLFLFQYHTIFNYSSSVLDLETRDGDTFDSSFIVQDCFNLVGEPFILWYLFSYMFLSEG